MAKIKNEEFRKRSLQQIESYVDQHPAEGGRLAKICGDTAGHCVKKYIEYQVDRVTGGVKTIDKNLQPET